MKGSLALLLLLLALLWCWQQSRMRPVDISAKPHTALLYGADAADSSWVFLGRGFAPQGVYQIIDTFTALSVKKVTLCGGQSWHLLQQMLGPPLQSGERLDLSCDNGHIEEINRSWMAPAKLLTLGIPLRLAALEGDDWQVLPGIGPVLAARIQGYRQKNGDFGAWQELQQVKGVGPKRIEAWQGYFLSDKNE